MKKSLIFLLLALLLLSFSACDETNVNGDTNNTTDGQESTEVTSPETDGTERNPESEKDTPDNNLVTEYVCPHSFLGYISNEDGWTPNVKIIKNATCETDGEKTQKCSLCKEDVVSIIPALGHETVIEKAISPSCTQDGKTEGSYCSRCNKIFVEQEIIPALGGEHIIVIDEAVEATCTQTGLSEGKHCSRCGKIYVFQAEISTKPHTTGDWIVDKEATCTENGKRHLECKDCDYREEEITSVQHQYSVSEESGTKTFSCNICDRMIENIEDIIILFQNNEDGTYTVEVSGGYGVINCDWIASEYSTSSILTGFSKKGTYSNTTQFAFSIDLCPSTSSGMAVVIDYNYIKIVATDELGQRAVYNFKLSNAELISSEHTIVDKSSP